MPVYYPAFVDLKDKRCVVIGGGPVAERKTLSLLKAGARVTVVSEELTKGLRRKKEQGAIVHVDRQYRRGDLADAFIVVAATSDSAVNSAVSREAPFLVNVADNPSLSNFIVPSVVSRGPLTIAISTGGASPAMAALIKRDLELSYGRGLASYVGLLKSLREKALIEIRDRGCRRRFLTMAVSDEMIDLLRTEGYAEAKRQLLKLYRTTKREAMWAER